jgi:putative phosphoesterase
MRIALISDLHGNELALRATLADIRKNGADQIVCLGDVATLGPRPREVLALLRELGCPCILGNHDEFLFNAPLIHSYTEAPVVVQAVDWCRAHLDVSDLAFLKAFALQLELQLEGGNRLFLFHGSPRSHMENLLSTTPAEELEEALGPNRAAVMAGGHTHLQMLRQHDGVLLVNPGSVGLPFKRFVSGRAPSLMAHAEYALVESRGEALSVHLRRVPLDRLSLRLEAAETDNPIRSMLLEEYA